MQGPRGQTARPCARQELSSMTFGRPEELMDRTVALLVRLVIAAVVGTMCVASPASAERRVALVIGNSAYQHTSPLDNPRNDANLMAETLRGLGFALVGNGAQVDLDKSAFDDILQKFGNQMVGADVALFYYAGHGVQVRGSNYLVPVNANPAREADVLLQAVDTSLARRHGGLRHETQPGSPRRLPQQSVRRARTAWSRGRAGADAGA
jgi:hypothetical protein